MDLLSPSDGTDTADGRVVSDVGICPFSALCLFPSRAGGFDGARLWGAQASARPGCQNLQIFPVIQYDWMGEPTRFTSLDSKCIVGLQIGDQVKLSFSRTRRSEVRIGRMVMILVVSMALLVAGMFSASVLIRETLDMGHILLASLVLAVCLFIIILYIRQQDEMSPSTRYPQSQSQSQTNVFILEPTNVCYWKGFLPIVVSVDGSGCQKW